MDTLTWIDECIVDYIAPQIYWSTDNNDSNGVSKYFISLKNYLQTVHTFASTNSVKMSVSNSNEVTADINIASTEKSILVDENGVKLNKSTGITESTASEEKLVTEKNVVDYVKTAIADALANVPTFEVDNN